LQDVASSSPAEKLWTEATLDRLLATELRGFCKAMGKKSKRKRFLAARESSALSI
jgi:hypothetical protein